MGHLCSASEGLHGRICSHVQRVDGLFICWQRWYKLWHRATGLWLPWWRCLPYVLHVDAIVDVFFSLSIWGTASRCEGRGADLSVRGWGWGAGGS